MQYPNAVADERLRTDPPSAALLPTDPHTREIAEDLYAEVADAPILSPHGHVDPRLLLDNDPFPDPVDLFIRHDHYVTRLLFAGGVSLDELGFAVDRPQDPRAVWQIVAENWHRFAGTASGYWLGHSFAHLFGIEGDLDATTADAVFDRISAVLNDPGFRPRALVDRFGIEVLATTDDPLDDLSAHRAIADDGAVAGRVIPTFRPDAYLDPAGAGFADRVQSLLEATAQPGTFGGYLRALEERRAFFVANGAVSTDHGVPDPFTADLAAADAERLFAAARAGRLEPDEQRLFRGHMLFQMARMSVADGLVMTVHPGIRRNHHAPTFEAYGPDTGHDIPVPTEFTDNLRPLLNAFGTAPGFQLVLFAVDETVYSRELAPLAGFYPSVYLGAPWWFLDAPDAMLRFRSAVTETAGFYRGSGFIDDTRAFLSIPARHDMARRVDSSFLARLVREGRVSRAVARRIARDLVDEIPRKAFKL